jgi:phosphoglycolate phosphatase-like HAD superfamily hydrolase
MSKALFIDIDGTLLKWETDLVAVVKGVQVEPTKGAVECLIEWHRKGYKLILTTKRPESMRKVTVQNLEAYGLLYDFLLMGIPTNRLVINDGPCGSIQLTKNEGLEGLEKL